MAKRLKEKAAAVEGKSKEYQPREKLQYRPSKLRCWPDDSILKAMEAVKGRKNRCESSGFGTKSTSKNSEGQNSWASYSWDE